jgi:hypothetical protein
VFFQRIRIAAKTIAVPQEEEREEEPRVRDRNASVII